MFKNFFNSFYYGKAGKADYTPENLPDNRIKLFFEMFKVRWSALIRLNLLYLLFLLPVLIWSVWNLLALEGVASAYISQEISAEEFSQQIRSITWYWLLIFWPCFAITGPATAGVSFVTRNWARDQHSFMLSDFKDALKGNWKQALVISTITGLLPLVIYTCWNFYGSMANTSSVFFVLPQVLSILLGVVWILALQIIYTMMVTYKLKLTDLIRNSVILALGKLPITVGIRLLSLALVIIGVVIAVIIPDTMIYVLLVLLLYYLMIGFSLSRFISASLANALCENYINTRIDGAETGIGLRQVTDEDYEIDPTMPQPDKKDEES